VRLVFCICRAVEPGGKYRETSMTQADSTFDTLDSLVTAVQRGRLNRREALRRGVAAGLAMPALATIAGAGVVAAQDATPAATPAGTVLDPNAKPGGILRVGLQADPAELDPHKTSLTAAWHLIEHVYEGLLTVDPSLTPVPQLAESWEVSEDGLTYTFKIRQGVKFHNGREMTTDDVVYSFDRIMDPATASPYSADFAKVTSFEATDASTVVATLSSPDASFLAKLVGASIAVVPKEVVEENGDLNQVMVGTGPFTFVEYIPNTSVTLERNPDYWDAPLPYLDGIELLVASENTSRRTALVSGTVDFIEYAPFQDMPIFEGDDTLAIYGDQNTNIRYMGINVTRQPFDKVEVRRAIAKVIDRQPIIDAAIFGAATPTVNIFPESFWAGSKAEIPAPDIEGAKALLESVGLGDGFKAKIHSWAAYSFLNAAAIVIQEQVKAIGIELETDFQENATYLENYFSGNFDLSVTGTSAYVDPNDVIEPNFYTDRVNVGTGYSNPDVDALIEEGIATTDQAARAEIYQKIQDILNQDLPWINLYIANQYEVAKTYVVGYEHVATGSNRYFRQVWLDQ
jgi:peptide/nickel transport system substrate-binding protein